jgi:hypothetical protein
MQTLTEEEEIMPSWKRWISEHLLIVELFLLALAVLNGYISVELFPSHPLLAALNGAMALTLALGIIMSWAATE